MPAGAIPSGALQSPFVDVVGAGGQATDFRRHWTLSPIWTKRTTPLAVLPLVEPAWWLLAVCRLGPKRNRPEDRPPPPPLKPTHDLHFF